MVMGEVFKLGDATVIACTEDDMRRPEWGGPLPMDPKSKHAPTDAEFTLLVEMWRGFDALRQLGWREAIYAPRDYSTFLAIEPGSTGIHECTRHEDGSFWIYDGDLWPSRPILWKPMPEEPSDARA
jgi:hypothetical protein